MAVIFAEEELQVRVLSSGFKAELCKQLSFFMVKNMVYDFAVNPRSTPQTEPIPGRESEMTKGRSGAVAFKVDDWAFVRRCLLMGTANGSYYAGAQELSQEFIQAMKAAIALDPTRMADEILYASDGHAINNHAPILALALLSADPSLEAKKGFKRIFRQVIRTGTHFHEWVKYTKSVRGMGRLIKDAGKIWLQDENVSWLSYQMLKYGQRYGYSFKDHLRLFKPASKEATANHSTLYDYVLGRGAESVNPDGDLSLLYWRDWLKANPTQGEKAVREGGLTFEMVTDVAEMNKGVWQALFESMPLNATLRNLATLTSVGVLRSDSVQNLDKLAKRLTNEHRLKVGRIHPVNVLSQSKVYAAGGSLGRSRKTWSPVPRVNDILEKTLELSFESLEPTGKVFLHAVDISASMGCYENDFGLTCREIAAAFALACAKVEHNYVIRGFSTEFVDLGITASDSFRSAIEKTANQRFGGTDASVTYDWAIEQGFNADVFCFWTDSESWAGRSHPTQRLAYYREKVNPNAKAIYTTLQSNNISLVDPKDPLSFDFGGFDPSLPKAIQLISQD